MSAQHKSGPWMSWRVIVAGVGEIGFAHGRDEQDALDHAIQEYGQLGSRGRHQGSSKQIFEDDDYLVEAVGSAPREKPPNPYPAGEGRHEAWEDGYAGRPMQWSKQGSTYVACYRQGERAAIAKATGSAA